MLWKCRLDLSSMFKDIYCIFPKLHASMTTLSFSIPKTEVWLRQNQFIRSIWQVQRPAFSLYFTNNFHLWKFMKRCMRFAIESSHWDCLCVLPMCITLFLVRIRYPKEWLIMIWIITWKNHYFSRYYFACQWMVNGYFWSIKIAKMNGLTIRFLAL